MGPAAARAMVDLVVVIDRVIAARGRVERRAAEILRADHRAILKSRFAVNERRVVRFHQPAATALFTDSNCSMAGPSSLWTRIYQRLGARRCGC